MILASAVAETLICMGGPEWLYSGIDVDTRDGGNRMYFVSETGVLTMLCAWALAAVLYIRVKKQIQHL